MPRAKQRSKGRRPAPRRPTMAEQSDPFALYMKAVQNPGAENDFVDRVFRTMRGRTPARLREDFCGTAAISCDWAARRPGNVATGLDLDVPTLAWGRANNVAKLGPDAAARVRLMRRNVLSPGAGTGGQDVVLAVNFSYWVFKERGMLRRYFAAARRGLVRDGLFILDILGGWELLEERRDATQIGGKKRGFTYIWEQARTNPITHETLCHIHFRFRDRSRMERAFTYDWRAWGMPEVREVLAEAGFRRSTVYWEGENSRGEGNGVFRALGKAAPKNCPAHLCYVVAER
ncbi:MAG: hypothetical protein WD749_00385 [Phycisphaerales bacterium]